VIPDGAPEMQTNVKCKENTAAWVGKCKMCKLEGTNECKEWQRQGNMATSATMEHSKNGTIQ